MLTFIITFKNAVFVDASINLFPGNMQCSNFFVGEITLYRLPVFFVVSSDEKAVVFRSQNQFPSKGF